MAAANDDYLNYSSLESGDSSSSLDEDNDKKIDLSFNNMDHLSVDKYLTKEDEKIRKRTEKLLLYNNVIINIPQSVFTMLNLTTLDISNNNLQTIPNQINRMVKLTKLCLRNNFLTENSFPKSLKRLTKLRELNLSGNQFTSVPNAILELESLRNLFLGGNRIKTIEPSIKNLNKLRVFYLGGNRIERLPNEIGQLTNLQALILCDNNLQSLPNSICNLRKLECLQLHTNSLKTLPNGLVFLRSLTELSLRENPLVVSFIRDMEFQPSSLLELAAKTVTIYKIPFTEADIPLTLREYLESSQCCVNPKCSGVYFNTRIEHVKFVDFCGRYKIPLLQYLCSSMCSDDKPAVTNNSDTKEDLMRRVLLG